MKPLNWLLVVVCFLSAVRAMNGQSIAKDSTIFLDFSFRANGDDIVLSTPFEVGRESDSAQIDVLRFYVGDLNLFNAQGTSATQEDQWHLIDASIHESLQFEYTVDALTHGLSFLLGVDSLTNDAGVHGGALDPTKGMYWAWQTGYINFKLEGSSENCPASKGGFTYHIGGFLDGMDASRKVELSLRRDAQISLNISNEISLVLEVDRLLDTAHHALGCRLMRPSKEAVDFVTTLGKFMYLEQ